MGYFWRLISGFLDLKHHFAFNYIIFSSKIDFEKAKQKTFVVSLCVVMFVVTRQIEFLYLSYFGPTCKLL